ncbi:F510_1955 family glycosylhydrolase [Thermaerobacter sp. PB12/4term]|uniref:F510_1955 family glycosylhydrolase n=1 Tax=Thermaerobacter sp. PB12/4term TaxID=2293838 RepID=UPI001FACA6A7|nr:hypothetical protein [Thermaerobacter sp. PB12/4term]
MKKSRPRPARRPAPARTRVALVLAAAVLVAGLGYAWYARSAGPEIRHVHGMAIDPFDPSRIWVATHDGLLVWREPGGWAGRVGPVMDLMGFAVAPERDVLYASGHPGPGVRLPNPVGLMASRDGDASWEPVSLSGEVDFHAMAVSPADRRRIYGFYYGDGLFYRSDDGGRTWTRTQVPALAGPLGRGPLQLVAHPKDPDTLLAAGEEGLLRSEDGGRTWKTILAGAVSAAAFVPRDPEQLLAYEAGTGLVRSADGGRTWQPLGLRVGDRDLVAAVAVHPADPQVVYVATFAGTLMQSRDGGSTWQALWPGP